MEKTLGGDRLGAGKKMKVHLHNYERSTHDLGYVWRSTMSAGTLVPFMSEVALPGDTFDINLMCDIKTHPTIGPLFGSYKIQLDVFMTPIRLYNAYLHNNMLGIGLNMSQVLLPQIELTASPTENNTDTDNSQINPSCILSYLGIRGVGMVPDTNTEDKVRSFNGIPLLVYWDIYKNYYANKQEEIGAVIHTEIATNVETVDEVNVEGGTALPQAPSNGTIGIVTGAQLNIEYTGTPPIGNQIMIKTLEHGEITAEDLTTSLTDTGAALTGFYNNARYGTVTTLINWRYRNVNDLNTGTTIIETFQLSAIDDMRLQILSWQVPTPYRIEDSTLLPYVYLTNFPKSLLSSQEGLGLKTYQSDLFNNWIQTDWIDGPTGISAITAIDTSGGDFTIDTLNLANKVYEMLNRIAVSGGSYDDWLDAVYTHERYRKCETPMYMGGLIKELIFQEVVSNSESETQPLGTLAGKGVMAKKHKGGNVTIKVDEPSYITGIISLTPRIDYSQGNKWDTHLETMDDLHKPALDEIGFQELITEQMAWWDTMWDETQTAWITKSAGKQPAWLNYMTNVNKTYGNFAIITNEMFMTLNRRYELNPTFGIKDLTTYIDPSKFNFIFAETALDAQNFWAQIAVDITARRKMSAKIMPNL